MHQRRTASDHARALGVEQHLAAGACVHNGWAPSELLDEDEFEAGVAAFSGTPLDVGSPQLSDVGAHAVLRAQRAYKLARREVEDALQREIERTTGLLPEEQLAAVAGLRKQLDNMQAQHVATLRDVAQRER